MSAAEELRKIIRDSMPFPPEVIEAYAKLEDIFTSGDLARLAGIPRSTAKFYVAKMVRLRMVTKIPGRRKYQKYANARTFSDWLKDLIRLAIVPLERGELG
ncbi:MAG TPA: hypothetical protein ENF98_00375 [Candidatus Bathyarchaeota archaeon]|nr:hypothetical protein [Candidatus Bathyarchaeota archaeon]